MWKLETTIEKPNQIWKCQIRDVSNQLISYGQVLELWQANPDFNEWYIDQLLKNQWQAVRWETPALTTELLDRPFEYVLVNSPSLDRRVDETSFANQFAETNNQSVISFANLGRNAILVVPTPIAASALYVHLIGFLRSAPRQQAVKLWQSVGAEMKQRVSEKPVWLSTAGGGVAWLHVRLDDRPKYYTYTPYRNVFGPNEKENE